MTLARKFSVRLETLHGAFCETLFSFENSEVITIHLGNIEHQSELLVRIHSHCHSAHVFLSTECDCREQLDFAMRAIAAEGTGIIIWLDQEGRSNGHLAKMKASQYRRSGLDQGSAYEKAGYPADSRDYSAAIEVLRFFSVVGVRLITNNQEKASAIADSGLTVQELIPTPEVGDNERS